MTTRRMHAQVIEAGDMSPEVAAAVRDAAESVRATIADNAKSILLAFAAGMVIGYSLRRDVI